MAPVAHEKAVPALALLLFNSDLDLQMTAAAALRRYGPKAQPAVGSLMQLIAAGVPDSNHPAPKTGKPIAPADAKLRVAAIGTLEAIGNGGLETAAPLLQAALRQPEVFVRQKAAEALGNLRPASAETRAAPRLMPTSRSMLSRSNKDFP